MPRGIAALKLLLESLGEEACSTPIGVGPFVLRRGLCAMEGLIFILAVRCASRCPVSNARRVSTGSWNTLRVGVPIYTCPGPRRAHRACSVSIAPVCPVSPLGVRGASTVRPRVVSSTSTSYTLSRTERATCWAVGHSTRRHTSGDTGGAPRSVALAISHEQCIIRFMIRLRFFFTRVRLRGT